MNPRLAIASALLRYPDATLRADLPDIARETMRAGFAPPQARRMLRLAHWLAQGDALDREETYVALFDRGRGTSLHVFEHVHGDTRERGAALAELGRMYAEAGLALEAPEMPDHLPLLLEFCAAAPAGVGANLLRQCAPVLDGLHARLLGNGTRAGRCYAAPVAAALAEGGLRPTRRPELVEPADEAAELARLDAEWEAEAVSFGPENDPDKAGARAKVAAMVQRLRGLRDRAPARHETHSGGHAP